MRVRTLDISHAQCGGGINSADYKLASTWLDKLGTRETLDHILSLTYSTLILLYRIISGLRSQRTPPISSYVSTSPVLKAKSPEIVVTGQSKPHAQMQM